MNVVPLDFFGPKNKRWYFGVLFAASLIIVGYLLCVFMLPSLSGDSSYYLKIAYDLSGGMSFFKDFNCSYTPLVLYYLSIPFYLDRNVGLEFLYAHAFVFYPLVAYAFYHVLGYFEPNRRIRLFFTVVLLAVIFVLLGAFVFLETGGTAVPIIGTLAIA